MSDPAPITPKPGWYADAEQPGMLRWFDGRAWTDFRQPEPTTAPAPAPQVIVQGRQKRPVNHVFHFCMTILTVGLWLPVWLIIAIAA